MRMCQKNKIKIPISKQIFYILSKFSPVKANPEAYKIEVFPSSIKSIINIFVLNYINFLGGFRGKIDFPLGERGMVKTIWNKLAEPRGKAFPLNIKTRMISIYT